MAFSRDKLLQDFHEKRVVLTPAQVETAMVMEEMLQPNPVNTRKVKWLSSDNAQEHSDTTRGARPPRQRTYVGDRGDKGNWGNWGN